MKLTKNFALSEFEESREAEKRGIDNSCPDFETAANLKALADNILQPISDHFQKAVNVNSGFRCMELNKAINKGKDKPSQHRRGEAADIEIAGLSNHVLAEWIRDNLPFDQLILENHTVGDPNSGWVHVSYCQHKERHSILTAVFDANGKPTYLQGLQV